jgi:hypothetical protein
MSTARKSSFSRSEERKRIPALLASSVRLCDGDTVHGTVVDEIPHSLGLLVRGQDVAIALRHRLCCARQPVQVSFLAPEVGGRALPATLVHVTALRGEDNVLRIGLRFEVERMVGEDVSAMLEVWRRIEELRS